MKLLLTSAGLSNESIKKAFFDLVGKPSKDIKVAFIPTAANVEQGDKWWLIKDLIVLQGMKLEQVDIVDISALSKKVIEERLKEADVLFFEGGNTFHLMHWIEKSGLKEMLPELLKKRVWAGVSAGSIAAGSKLSTFDERIYDDDEDPGEYKGTDGLGYVDFSIRPHFNSPMFPASTAQRIKELAEKYKSSIYAIDDNSAIMVEGDKMEIISEGKWEKF